jgi:hypothetical protein
MSKRKKSKSLVEIKIPSGNPHLVEIKTLSGNINP